MILDPSDNAFWIFAGVVILLVILMLVTNLGGNLFDFAKVLFGGLI